MEVKLPSQPGVEATLTVYPEHDPPFRFSLCLRYRDVARRLTVIGSSMHATLDGVFSALDQELRQLCGGR